MSFGIEVFDENGKEVFAIGRKYFVFVGFIEFPAASSYNPNSIRSTSFTLPPTVPMNEVPYTNVDLTQSPAFLSISGRIVNVTFDPYKNSSGVWVRGKTRVNYGYYA